MYGAENISNLSDNQQASVDYIKRNNLQNLFTEMLNNVVSTKSKEPVVDMITYLANLVDKKDLEKQGIKLDNLEKILPIPLIKEFSFPQNSNVFIKKYLKSEQFEKLKGVKTKFGGTISHMIDAGLKVDNKETVGIYATDGDAYNKFSSIFKLAIKNLQEFDEKTALLDIPDNRGIFTISENHNLRNKLFSIRMKYARNLKLYPYNPFAKNHTTKKIKEVLLQNIKLIKENENGTFYEMDNDKIKKLENKFFDFEENFFVSYGSSRENSGIYLSQDEKVAYLINYNDHLQIVIIDTNCDFKGAHKRLKNINEELNKLLEFDYCEDYGYLTTCPSNVGMGLKITTNINIPNVARQGNFLICCKNWSLRFKKILDSQVSFDHEIISKHKHGVSEISFVNSYMTKICSLINFELNLLNNSNYVEQELDLGKMKKNMKDLYSKYFDKYKFVVTPNMKSFNSLFTLDPSKLLYSFLIPDKESYVIYKDFIFDYMTAFTGFNMLDISAPLNRKRLLEIYTQKISTEILDKYEESVENFNSKNLKRTTLIFRRNTKKQNFTNILSRDDLSTMYKRFLKLSEEIKEKFGGKIFEESNINELFSTDFKFVLEEFIQIFKVDGNSKNFVCGYISADDKTLVIFNGINHIKLISISYDGKIKFNYTKLCSILEFIEDKIVLEFDEIYGNLTCKPLNSGSSFEMRQTFQQTDTESLIIACEKVDLACSKILSTGIEIYNRNKINLSQNDILEKFINFSNSISKE